MLYTSFYFRLITYKLTRWIWKPTLAIICIRQPQYFFDIYLTFGKRTFLFRMLDKSLTRGIAPLFKIIKNRYVEIKEEIPSYLED